MQLPKMGCKIHNLYHALDSNLQWEDKDYPLTILAKSTTVYYCFVFCVLSARHTHRVHHLFNTAQERRFLMSNTLFVQRDASMMM